MTKLKNQNSLQFKNLNCAKKKKKKKLFSTTLENSKYDKTQKPKLGEEKKN